MKPIHLAALLLPIAAHAADPINCARAHTPTERTICRTPALLQADARTTAYYEIAIQYVGMGERDHLHDAQLAFPAKRSRCGTDTACILRAYATQTAPLEAIIQRVKTHGPF